MTSIAQRSAVDDTGLPIIQPRLQTTPGGGLPLPYEQYNGPRSGHWSVSSSINGSAIDDRAPTIHRDPGPMKDDGGPKHVHPLPASVLKKLAKANEAKQLHREDTKSEKKAGREKQEFADPPKPDSVRTELPKGFFVPKMNARGIRVLGKNGQSEVMKRPQITMPVIKEVEPEEEKKEGQDAKSEKSNAPSPQPSVRTKGAPLVSSHTAQQSRKVRILSKDGMEVFMDLPKLSGVSKTASQPQTSPESRQESELNKQERVNKTAEAEKAERDARAARAAKKLQAERAEEERRKKQADLAAEKVMSAAMPNSSTASKKSSAPSTKSSSKDSDRPTRRPTPVDITSKPESVASSITSIAPSWKPNSANAGSQASFQSFKPPSKVSSTPEWQDVGRDGWHRSTSNQKSQHSGALHSQWSNNMSQRTHEHSFNHGWRLEEAEAHDGWAPSRSLQSPFTIRSSRKAAGFEDINGYVGMPQQQPRRSASLRSSRIHGMGFEQISPYGGFSQPPLQYDMPEQQLHPNPSLRSAFINGKGFEEIESRGSGNQPPGQYRQPSLSHLPSNNGSDVQEASPPPFPQRESPFERPPTVYAGRGWISPHPLSRAPSEYDEGPQPAIHVPSSGDIRGVATMTYDDWLDIQQGEDQAWVRRNVSRTTSDAGSREKAGSWGHRLQPLPGSESRMSYRSPVAESLHSRQWSSMQGSVHQSVRYGQAPSQAGSNDRDAGSGKWSHNMHEQCNNHWGDRVGSDQLPMPWDANRRPTLQQKKPFDPGYLGWD